MRTITLSLHEVRLLKIALVDAMNSNEEFPDKECADELYERLKKVQYGIPNEFRHCQRNACMGDAAHE